MEQIYVKMYCAEELECFHKLIIIKLATISGKNFSREVVITYYFRSRSQIAGSHTVEWNRTGLVPKIAEVFSVFTQTVNLTQLMNCEA